MIKIILFIILLGIIVSLGSALVQMLSDKGSSDKMMKSLAARVALSAVFVIVLFTLYKLGYIEPNRLPS